MQPLNLRRKTPIFNSETGAIIMKSKKNNNLSIFVVVFSICLFGVFMYNEDVKSIAEFPFSRPKIQETQEGGVSSKNVEDNRKKVLEDKDISVIVTKSSSKNKEEREREDEDSSDDDDDDDQKEEHGELKKIVVSEKEREDEEYEEEEEIELPPEDCDLFNGKWVLDNVTHPLYKENECEFLTSQVTCMKNGRSDSLYQNWKWQPKDCSLPKFKPKLLFQKIRGKRLMFVGDSLNRNQWESMVCMVQSVVPSDKKTWYKNGSLAILKIQEPEHITTVEFYWAPFLVESNSDDPNMHSILNRIIMPESIEKHGVNWKNVDYLIFNTYIWWMNTFNMKVLRGSSFDEGATEYEEVPRPTAYERVLRTWSKWVDNNINPNKTKVFFTSISPLHIKSEDWDNPNGIKCAKETTPVLNTSTPLNVGTDRRLFVIANNVTKSMKVPVYFLNITTLSEYRKDAHTSVYTIRQGKMLTPEQQADPATYADCIHWCLPGLPDTWNEFLYTRIISHS